MNKPMSEPMKERKTNSGRGVARAALLAFGLLAAAMALTSLYTGSLATALTRMHAGSPVARRTAPAPDQTERGPRVVLWAWERPEDLRFVAPQDAGVAYLARTIRLRGNELLDRPRLQPLRIHPGAALVAVVRIETDRDLPLALSAEQRSAAVSAIAAAAATPGITAVQVDYDATVSERAFYRDLLRDLRPRLPHTLELSITALASWCLGDPWLAGLPIDEAVPMLFRMGPDRGPVLLRLESGGDFRDPVCRGSIGLSTDEPLSKLRKLPAGRRLYVFHPRPWSPAAAQRILSEVKQWR